MKKKIILFSIIMVLYATLVYQMFSNYNQYSFWQGAVPNVSTASAVAEAVFSAAYGEEISNAKPYSVVFKKLTGSWYVRTFTEEDQPGIWLEIIIRARDGKIMKLTMEQ